MVQKSDPTADREPIGPLVRGKHVAVGMILVGAVLALSTGWFYRSLQRRPLEFWGTETARLIMHAPTVYAWQLLPHGSNALPAESIEIDTITFATTTYDIAHQREVSISPGFSHVRHGLLNDAAFTWSETPPDDGTIWRYALHFIDGERTATLLFDTECRKVAVAESRARAATDPLAAPVRTFLEEQFLSDHVLSGHEKTESTHR